MRKREVEGGDYREGSAVEGWKGSSEKWMSRSGEGRVGSRRGESELSSRFSSTQFH